MVGTDHAVCMDCRPMGCCHLACIRRTEAEVLMFERARFRRVLVTI